MKIERPSWGSRYYLGLASSSARLRVEYCYCVNCTCACFHAAPRGSTPAPRKTEAEAESRRKQKMRSKKMRSKNAKKCQVRPSESLQYCSRLLFAFARLGRPARGRRSSRLSTARGLPIASPCAPCVLLVPGARPRASGPHCLRQRRDERPLITRHDDGEREGGFSLWNPELFPR